VKSISVEELRVIEASGNKFLVAMARGYYNRMMALCTIRNLNAVVT
jgi:hypothetical protein